MVAASCEPNESIIGRSGNRHRPPQERVLSAACRQVGSSAGASFCLSRPAGAGGLAHYLRLRLRYVHYSQLRVLSLRYVLVAPFTRT